MMALSKRTNRSFFYGGLMAAFLVGGRLPAPDVLMMPILCGDVLVGMSKLPNQPSHSVDDLKYLTGNRSFLVATAPPKANSPKTPTTLEIRSTESGRLIEKLEGHKAPVHLAALHSRTPGVLVSADTSGEVRLWWSSTALSHEKKVSQVIATFSSQITALAIEPESQRVYLATADGGIYFIPIGFEVSQVEGTTIDIAPALSPLQGNDLAYKNEINIELIPAHQRADYTPLSPRKLESPQENASPIFSFRFSADRKTLMGTSRNQVRFWNLLPTGFAQSSSQEADLGSNTLSLSSSQDEDFYLVGASVSPSAEYVLLGTNQGSVILHHRPSGKKVDFDLQIDSGPMRSQTRQSEILYLDFLSEDPMIVQVVTRSFRLLPFLVQQDSEQELHVTPLPSSQFAPLNVPGEVVGSRRGLL